MKNSELKEYLNTFPDDADVSVIIVNCKKRKLYPVTEHHGVTDMEQPVFCLDIGEPENLDEPDADIEGQMDFSDIPGVMP